MLAYTNALAARLDAAYALFGGTTYGLASLADLREAMPDVGRTVFDALVQQQRHARRYWLQAAEGRHGITARDRAAGIVENGELMLYICRREES